MIAQREIGYSNCICDIHRYLKNESVTFEELKEFIASEHKHWTEYIRSKSHAHESSCWIDDDRV